MGSSDKIVKLPKLGIMLPYEGVVSPDGIVEVAQSAELAGLESVWVGDHIAFPVEMNSINPTTPTGKYPFPLDNPRLEAFTALAFLAGATSTIKLGVNACVVPYRNPLLLGKVVSTLDHLSHGRVIFGATLGWCSEEFEALGVDFELRRQKLEEGIQILRALWEDQQPSYQGETFSFDPVHMQPKPNQSPMPIFFGGHSRPALRRAAALGDGWLSVRLPPDELAVHVEFLKKERRSSPRAGQPFTVTTNFPVRVGTDRADGVDLSDLDQTTKALQNLSEAGADLVIVVVTSHASAEILEAIKILKVIKENN
ncbi:MAG: LLM class F420-dependent oxidoreductase [Acidimicrobiales bacterium]|nr:LLM class F420-dependent oxidoreductase [Acidimicrobiales bacterium]